MILTRTTLFALLLISTFSLRGQETAMDWTRTECGTSTEHHLFSELDSGYVIVIDFVMMNCSPCVTATNGIKNIVRDYDGTHPNKVRFYNVGFTNAITCAQMLAWKDANGFWSKVFTQGAEETSYYGGMGMPTVVVLGGASEHKVYYSELGYSSSDGPAIRASIDQAIAESNVSAIPDPSINVHLDVFPNPFTEFVTLHLSSLQPVSHITFTDVSGREILRRHIETSGTEITMTIPTNDLVSGTYLIGVHLQQGFIAVKKVYKK